MRLTDIRNSRTISLLIFASGFFVAAVIVSVFSVLQNDESNLAAGPVGWTQEAGAGIIAPACGSSGTSITCQGNQPRVTFTWSTSYDTGGRRCEIVVNGSVIRSNEQCSSGSYTWGGGSSNTTYSYQIRVE